MYRLNFICFSINNWEKRRARKQQFMLHLSLREDVGKVLYIEPPLSLLRLLFLPFLELKNKDNRKRWKRALAFKIDPMSDSPKLFIFTPIFFMPFSFLVQFVYNLNRYISFLIVRLKIQYLGFNNTVLWLYHPFDHMLLEWFNFRMIAIFDWAEKWSEYFTELPQYRRRQISKFEERIIKGVDIPFTVSQKLLGIAAKLNKNARYLRDGTIPELFYGNDIKPSADIEKIKKPILGYLGTITERLDFDLLKLMARDLPDTSIVLVGQVNYRRVDISELKDINNIYFLGGRKYEELGKYAKNFDVCILPYRNKYSSYMSPPTKIFDYLAAGKPIVSTALPPLDEYSEYIKVANSKKEFIGLIKEALKGEPTEFVAKRLQKAKENSWSFRADEIMNIIMHSLGR